MQCRTSPFCHLFSFVPCLCDWYQYLVGHHMKEGECLRAALVSYLHAVSLYTRLSLSDDPEAVQMKENITKSAVMMGMPPNVDMSVIFTNMEKMINVMKKQIDKGI